MRITFHRGGCKKKDEHHKEEGIELGASKIECLSSRREGLGHFLHKTQCILYELWLAFYWLAYLI
jgi:hypothetical protein